MSRIEWKLVASVAVVVGTVVTATAASAARPTLTYYLPKASVSASVSQRLVACPAVGDGEVEVLTQWELKATQIPDHSQPVMIDAGSGFLAKRSVGLSYNEDGTLTSLNASSEGQGSAVIVSALKLAGAVAPLVSGTGLIEYSATTKALPNVFNLPAAAVEQRCTAATLALLDQYDSARNRLANLESKLSEDGFTDSEKAILSAADDKLAAIEEQLTVSNDAEDALDDELASMLPGKAEKPAKKVHVDHPDYSGWFEPKFAATEIAKIPGSQHGFVVGWKANAVAARAVLIGTAQSSKPNRDLAYRKAVPAKLTGAPCSDAFDAEKQSCPIDESPKGSRASDSIKFAIPQLSALFYLPVGSAGIFGSREVKAAFDGWGRPKDLSYGSDPGAKNIAESVDALGDAATSVHNARLDAINHKIELAKAVKELKDLQAP
ncbi:MAG: hypothetical protein ACKOQ3_02960 [Novosphingobium sp.]